MGKYDWLKRSPTQGRYKIAKYKFSCIEKIPPMLNEDAEATIKKLKQTHPTAEYKKVKVR